MCPIAKIGRVSTANTIGMGAYHVDLSTHEVPGGDVFVTEFFDKLGALGPLARCGPTYRMRKVDISWPLTVTSVRLTQYESDLRVSKEVSNERRGLFAGLEDRPIFWFLDADDTADPIQLVTTSIVLILTTHFTTLFN